MARRFCVGEAPGCWNVRTAHRGRHYFGVGMVCLGAPEHDDRARFQAGVTSALHSANGEAVEGATWAMFRSGSFPAGEKADVTGRVRRVAPRWISLRGGGELPGLPRCAKEGGPEQHAAGKGGLTAREADRDVQPAHRVFVDRQLVADLPGSVDTRGASGGSVPHGSNMDACTGFRHRTF